MKSIFLSTCLLIILLACVSRTKELESLKVTDLNLDSIEKARISKPLPPLIIYSQYNFIELKSKDSIFFFQITGSFDDIGNIILDKDYLKYEHEPLIQVFDLKTFVDSLLSARTKLFDGTYDNRITIISDTSIIRNNEIFQDFKTYNGDTINFIARKIFDFEKELLAKSMIEKNR